MLFSRASYQWLQVNLEILKALGSIPKAKITRNTNREWLMTESSDTHRWEVGGARAITELGKWEESSTEPKERRVSRNKGKTMKIKAESNKLEKLTYLFLRKPKAKVLWK